MKDSNGNSVSVSSSKLQQKIDELNKKIESLETENQELKEQLSEYKNVHQKIKHLPKYQKRFLQLLIMKMIND